MSVFPPIRDTIAPAEDDELPAGLRLSEDCPVRRVRQEFAPGEYPPFPAGVGHRGHVIAREIATLAIRAKSIVQETPVVWAHGVSHVDIIADQCAFEVKSVRERTPSNAHIRQVQRMMYAWEASGREPLRAWGVLLADPINYNVTGPFRVFLTPTIRGQIEQMIAATGEALRRLGDGADVNDRETYSELECTCRQCFSTGPTGDVPPDIDEAAFALDLLQEQARDIEREIVQLKEQLAESMTPGDKFDLKLVSGKLSLSKPRERTQVAWSKAAAAGVIPDHVLRGVEDAGFVSVVKTDPFVQLRPNRGASSG